MSDPSLSGLVIASLLGFFTVWYVVQKRIFSRMHSEGFSFNSGGLGVEPCSRPVVSMFATVRNRSQPSAVER